MFASHFQYKTLSRVERIHLPETILIDTHSVKYPTQVYKEGDIFGDKLLRFPSSKMNFTNLRWVLETENFADGEIGALLYMGLLRGEIKNVLLLGDAMNQTWDLTRLAEIPAEYKNLQTVKHGTNADSPLIGLWIKVLSGISQVNKT